MSVNKNRKKYNYNITPQDFYGMNPKSLDYFKRMKDILEAHETKAKNILFRKIILDNQKKINYENEMSRLMGELRKVNLDDKTKEGLQNRISKIKDLGKRIGHNIHLKERL